MGIDPRDLKVLQDEARRRLFAKALEERKKKQAPEKSNFLQSAFSTLKSSPGQALKGLDKFTRAVEDAPIPGGPAVAKIARGDIKGALWFDPQKEDEGVPRLGDPKKYVSKEIKEAIPGRAGRITAGVSEAVLDPTNLLGIGIVSKARKGSRLARIAAEALGRGDMSKKSYLAMLGASGAAATVGGEVAGTPGALAGGLLGGWGSASLTMRNRKIREAARIEAAKTKEGARNLDGMREEVAEGIRRSEDRYQSYKTADGKVAKVLTEEGLVRHIGDRGAEFAVLRNQQKGLEAVLLSDPENPALVKRFEDLKSNIDAQAEATDALSSVLEYMRDAGRSGLPVSDEYDFGRTIRNYKDQATATRRLTVDAAQTTQKALDLTSAAEKLPDFRFEEEARGRLGEIFRKQTLEAPGSVEGLIARVRDIEAQGLANKDAVGTQREAVKLSKAAQKARQDEILAQFPSGSKSAARTYLSALITGKDAEGAFANLTRKFPSAREMRPEIDQSMSELVTLHRASGETETTLKDLLASGKSVDQDFKTARRTMDDTLATEFGKATKQLSDRIIQIPGQAGRYRITRMAVQNGKPALVLDYIKPSKSVEEILESGASVRAEGELAAREKLQEVKDLKAEQAALRKAGDEGGASELVNPIREAEAEAKRLKEPARPLSSKQLPSAERRMIVPLDDAREFIVSKPSKSGTPAALARAGYRDVRTVTMLNREATLRVRGEEITRNLENLKLERENILSKIDQRDIQLANAGMAPSLEVATAQGRLTQVDELISRFETEEQINVSDQEAIQQSILGSQQALEATLAQAADEAEQTARLLEQSRVDETAAWEKINQSLAAEPEDAAFQYLQRQREINEVTLAELEGRTAKRMTQAAYDQEIENLNELATRERASLPKPAQEAMGNFANQYSRALHKIGDQNAILRLFVPLNNLYRHIDPDAQREGLLGWGRRVVMGTGMRSESAEGLMAGFFNGQQAAAQIADLDYGTVKRGIGKLADNYLDKLAVSGDAKVAPWAREVMSLKDPAERTAAVLRRASKSIDSREWKAELEGVPDSAKQEVYELLNDKLEVGSRNPSLFQYENTDPSFFSQMRQYGKQAKQVRDLSGVKGIARNLLRREYRDYVPRGRIQNADGSIGVVKDRTLATDLYEIMQNAVLDPKRAARTGMIGPQPVPSLAEMMVPGKEWEVTLAANMLNKINTDAVFKKLSGQLKDPKQIDALKQGQDIQPSEWKDPMLAEDWPKLRGVLIPDNAKGIWADVDKLANGIQKVAASTIVGDGSFATVQGLIGAAMSPISTAKMVRQYAKHAFTDEGFAAWMGDGQNYNDVVDLANRGLGIGRASMTGSNATGNIFQSIPGLKTIGNAMAGLDKITFDRMQLMNKVQAVRTFEADLQLFRAFGPEVSDQFIDGIPTLKALHKMTDIYQSTPDEIRSALVRQANNALGGIGRSQTLLGRNRQALESTLLFVPGFFRARAGLINSVSKMLSAPNSPEGYLAASILAREVTFRLGFAASVAAATGTLDEFKEETDSWATLDPRRSGGILSGPLGDGGYLGLSWGNQAPKLYTQMLLGFKQGEFNLDPQDRLKAIQTFFEGRQNPVIGGIIDQVRGEDFMGRPVQSTRDRIVNSLGAITPMFFANTVGEINEADYRNDLNPLALGAQSGTEFFGINVRPVVPFEKLNNRFAKWQEENYPGEAPLAWNDPATPSAFKQLARQDGAISEAEEQWISDLSRRSNADRHSRDIVYKNFEEQSAAYDAEVARMGSELNAGKLTPEEFRQRYSSIQEDRADAANTMNQILAKMGVDQSADPLPIAGKSPELARLMAEYNAIKPQQFSKRQITEGGIVADTDIDWGRYKQERERVLDAYSPEIVEQFEATRVPEDPNVARLQDARVVLDTYFDKLPKYRGLNNVEGKTLDGYKSVLFATEQSLRDRGISLPREQAFRLALQKMQQDGQISNPKQAQIAALAMKAALDSQFALSMRSMGALTFLLENPDVFEWYPWLEAELPTKLKSLIKQAPRSTQSILERELRGSQLSSVR